VPISVITVNWNGAEVVGEYVAGLRRQRVPPHETIVVDNGSTDGSDREFEAAGARVVRLPENRGFCAPNNIGAAQATGDAVLLLNNDTSVGPDLIARLEDALRACPDFDLFACSMRRWDAPEILENAGIGYRRTLSGYQLGRGRPAAEWARVCEVFGPSGGAALIRRTVIDDIGLFDEAFFAYNEDVDFALRARLAGYRCLYLPDAVVRHLEGRTAARLGSRKVFLIQRNAEWAMLKNVPKPVLRRFGLLHTVYVAQQMVRNGRLAPMVWKARNEARRNPRPAGPPPRISTAEFAAWLDVSRR
jgi:GT2 family glycosyltransferase